MTIRATSGHHAAGNAMPPCADPNRFAMIEAPAMRGYVSHGALAPLSRPMLFAIAA
jgi:hypothetical protein